MEIYTRMTPYSCSTCGKMFTQNSDLKKHERIHTGVKSYACSTCGNMFTQNGSRMHVLHVEMCSHEMPIVKCMNSSTQVLSHACSTCGKKFTQSHHRKIHERIHTPVTP